ncbi:FAD-dependent oxidoreductase [Streptomyces sp. NPDC058378]|uniref:FAD-dependent oxidoreductase n=1 Tax=Streptomyces sp. NPDC058378 TaxID=3346469 RepID=UPI003663248F
MNTQRETDRPAPHRVLILGAGYAGMAAAIQLAARVRRQQDVLVTLVNAQDRFTERLRLHMAATGQQLGELSIPELLDGTGAEFVRGWVMAVDADARTVRIDGDRVLHYDTLVYGLGSVADTSSVPGVEEYAYTLNGPQEAEAVARRPRFAADRSQQRDATERFFTAATGGDMNSLLELLSPDVTLWTDGGGKVRQALRPVVGASTVAAWFAAIGTVTYQGVEPADMKAELVEINGGPGLVFSGAGRVIATVTFDFDAEPGRGPEAQVLESERSFRGMGGGTASHPPTLPAQLTECDRLATGRGHALACQIHRRDDPRR